MFFLSCLGDWFAELNQPLVADRELDIMYSRRESKIHLILFLFLESASIHANLDLLGFLKYKILSNFD